MKKGIIIATWFFLVLIPSLWAQEGDILYNGSYDSIPFIDFITAIENQSGLKFFYLNDWVKDIRITQSGENLSLRTTLDSALLPAGIHYLLLGQGIYLSQKRAFQTEIPDYSGFLVDMDESTIFEASGGLTRTELMYINGRKLRILDTLVVGTVEEGDGLPEAVINGKITDMETGEPLIGATVFFNELSLGAATDVDGRYSIVVPPGKYTVEYKCMGMEEQKYFMNVLSGGNISIPMQKSVISLTEVVVQADRYHNIRGTQMGIERLNYKTLKEVSAVMGEKDVLKVAQMLPGVQSVGEGAAGFNVRGSAHDQNLIYINKVPVYNSAHLFGFFTTFNPDIIKDFTLYKSNMPVSYGGRLASIFDITAKQGNMNKFGARGGISPVTGHMTLESPIKKGKSAILLAGRSTYSDYLMKQVEIDLPELKNSKAQFYDLTGALTWEPGDKTLIKTFGYMSHDRFTLAKSQDYAYSNLGGSLIVRQRVGSRININMVAAYGEYNFETTNRNQESDAYTQDYRISHYEGKLDMSWLTSGRHKFTFGASGIYYDLDRGHIEPFGEESRRVPVDLGVDHGIEAAVYAADEISLFKWLTFYGGLRYVVYKSLGPDEVMLYGPDEPHELWNISDTLDLGHNEVGTTYTSLEPRAALNLMLGPFNSLKFSYNRVKQFMFMLTNTIAISPTDQWKLCDYHLKPSFAEQYSAGYYLNIPRGSINASVEFYYKTMNGIPEYKDGASFISTPHTESLIVYGDQEAYGVEFMFRKGTGKLSGWLSYSYSRSFMQVVSPFLGESINQGKVYPSNYDRPHSASLVSNLKLNRRISISTNVVYMTGRPVTYPITTYWMENAQFLKYSDRNSYRLPDYFRVDLSINLEGNLKRKKLFHSYWTINLYNVTGRQNAYSVYFKREDGVINGYKLSIFGRLIATLSWNFKLGNYATE